MKRLFNLITAALIIIGFFQYDYTAFAEEKQPEASAYILMECSTGKVLEEKEGRKRLPVGTMAKLMTALLAGEKIESGQWRPDTVLTASDCVKGIKGAVIWLTPGEEMTVDNLLKGLIAGNANDAAAVFAEQISGSSEDFVMDMNARAFELGMYDTRFASPYGIDDDEAYSTAYDIGLLCCELSKLECISSYFKIWRDFLRDGATELVNENTFARTYEGMTGWKASHTEKSGWCIAAGAERNGMECAAIILGAKDKDSRFAMARELFKQGFSKYMLTLPGFSSEFMKPVPVKGGVSENVDVEAEGLTGLVVPKTNSALKAVLVLPKYVHAPVEKGKKIGSIAFYNGDTLLLETALVAKENVEAMTISTAVEKILVKLCKL